MDFPAPPALLPMTRIRCEVGALVSLGGPAKHGERRYVPLGGGSVVGPELNGTLVEVMRADASFHADERQAVLRALQAKFTLTDDEAHAVLEAARRYRCRTLIASTSEAGPPAAWWKRRAAAWGSTASSGKAASSTPCCPATFPANP